MNYFLSLHLGQLLIMWWSFVRLLDVGVSWNRDQTVSNIAFHARIQKVLSEGVQLFFFFFRGARLQRPSKAGNYRPASETPLKWRFAGGPIMVHRWMLTWQLCDIQGIWTSITRKPYKFVIFQWGSGPLVSPSESALAFWQQKCAVWAGNTVRLWLC